jgi:hypothetical protein
VQALAAPKVVAVGIAPTAESEALEEQLRRMVAAAPRASRSVRKAVRAAYALYYAATGPRPKPPKTLADLQARPLQVVEAENGAAYGDLQACVARLTDAIEPKLRDK